MEAVDGFVVGALAGLVPDACAPTATPDQVRLLRDLYDAQVQSRHLDFAARWLQTQSKGYYTIGSAGHESNAALGLLSRVTDPALLHYRSGGFFAARATVAARSGQPVDPDPVRAILLSLTCAAADPISGGRHKVFGDARLHIVPQTSTIGSHLPRAVGLGLSLGLAGPLDHQTPWPSDAIVLCSFGDASANHSTAVGALNAAAYLTHRGLPCPVLFVCEDNGRGISTPSPAGWPEAMLRGLPGLDYFAAAGDSPLSLLEITRESLDAVRATRRPAVLHLHTVRFMGHAGSDAEVAYRSQRQIEADYLHDPIVATARALVDAGALTGARALEIYQQHRERVMTAAAEVIDEARLDTREAVTAPLQLPTATPRLRPPSETARSSVWRERPPEAGPPLTLAQAINATLTDLLAAHDEAVVFGEDVGVKGGVYGLTRGLRKRFGGSRVFDTLLDEQTILGIALGSALAGFVPIPEIQYLAYLHNAADQLRGEAASLAFFSNGQYRNGMVIRVASFAYQRGFGGHFHNDNSIAFLRDIPGIVIAVPSHPADAPGLLRTCFALARQEGRVCVFLEPIALYHARDLLADGDGRWTAPYSPPGQSVDGPQLALGQLGIHAAEASGGNADPGATPPDRKLAVVTFGNGTYLSLRAADRLRRKGIHVTVIDLRWLAPLPTAALADAVRSHRATLIVDETRHSGGVGGSLVAALVESGYTGRIGRVDSADSYIPLGPAADTVLLSEQDITDAALRLLAP